MAYMKPHPETWRNHHYRRRLNGVGAPGGEALPPVAGRGQALVLPHRIGNWSLTRWQQRLVKTGGRLIKPAPYWWLLLAESHSSAT
jgi:hypothetical protein